jgi:hypothetical protein
MSVRNGIILVVTLATISLLVACGGNSPTAVAPPSGGYSASNLNGTYVFSVSGTDDVNALPYTIVGTLTANGSGGITGGALDMNDEAFADSSPVIAPVADAAINSNSSYKVGVDGRGQATLNVSTPFGSSIKLDFVLSSSAHGLVTEFDSIATGSGTLDLQASGVTPTGSYAFSFSGGDASGVFATVGNFTLGSGNAITGLADFNSGGAAYVSQALSGSVVLGPSATPATLLTTSSFTGRTFDVYAIDATHLKFIELDSFGTLSGDAFSQTSTTVPTGNLAFTLTGFISSGEPFAAGGYMVTDGAGNITTASTEDYNEDGTPSSAPVPFSGVYTSAGTGRYTLGNFSDFIGGSLYAAYPSSGGLLLLEIDGLGSITVGAAYAPQTSTTFAASQGYALNLTGDNLTDGVEVDDIAEFTAASGGTLTGIIDENYDPGNTGLIYDQTLTGNYGSIDTTGRYGISATSGTSSSNGTLNGGFGLTFYSVDGTTFPFIESDSGQVSTGVLVAQSGSSGASGAARSHMFIPRPLVRPHAAKQKKK